MKITLLRGALLAAVLFLLVSVLGGSAIWAAFGFAGNLDVSGRAEIVAEAPPELGAGWPAYGGDAGGGRYSAAAQITPENVRRLDIAWTYRTGAFKGRDQARENSAFEGTPILVDGALILCTQFNDVIAIDPGSGAEKWRYDPHVPLDGEPGNQFVCRGVTHWADASAPADAACASRVLMGTVDARLIAIDAKTGKPCAGFGENGEVRIAPSEPLRWAGEYQITSAPAVIGETVIVGSSISDNLRAAAPFGTVHAFNARTGAPAWNFDPIPRSAGDPARASWAGASADTTGHANVWATISVDAARGLVFLPTSSPSPDFFGGLRAGDNHYANSVVALNAATGAVVWSFQTVHHDVWDYDLPAQPGLYRVWKDGAFHDVVAQVTKTGLVFVLDRDTGAPFLPIEERPAPQNGAEGEALSPTQPMPTATAPIVPNTVSPDDAFGVTLWDRLSCRASIRALRREGLFTPPSLQGTLVYPFTGGGANWGGAAYDPRRNLLVVNMNNLGHVIRLMPATDEEHVQSLSEDTEFAPMEGAPYSMTREVLLSPLGLPCTPAPWGVIAGVDLASGKIVWRRTLGATRDLAHGVDLPLGTPSLGGPIVTAGGLVFIGAAMDDYLRAFDVATGEELWKGRLPAGGQATPISYEWNGRQYVVIAAGGHARLGSRLGDHLVAFALPSSR
jgi:quinoprotein glucose dehydrogenase